MRLLAVDKASYDPFGEFGILQRRKERIAPDGVAGELTLEQDRILVDKAFLERESRWKMYSKIRGQEIGTNDVVEVDLEDDLDLDDDYDEHKSETYGKFIL